MSEISARSLAVSMSLLSETVNSPLASAWDNWGLSAFEWLAVSWYDPCFDLLSYFMTLARFVGEVDGILELRCLRSGHDHGHW